MYADRHAGDYGVRLGSLGLSLTGVGLVLAGLVFAAPNVVSRLTHETIVKLIPVDPPPPPLPIPTPASHASAAPAPAPRPDTPERIVETPPTNWLDLATTPPLPPSPFGTSGVRVDPAPPPPAPVLTDAAIDPRFAGAFQPDYPASERRAGHEGEVTVRVSIGIDGRVTAVERVSATSDAFFAATRERALAGWRFKPATRDGIPVVSSRVMHVRFVLDD